jgi:leader peptidase (prepilin peptidase)/N-methyltransferase
VIPAIVGALLGAIAGSFLGTIILRWPEGRSILRGRSQCDGCGRALGPVDLVPVLSALVLRGRCRSCGARIDPLHAGVEIGCALIGGIALFLFPDPAGLIWALFGWLLLTLAILDWRHFWLPDALTLPLALIGLTLGEWATGVLLVDRAIGAALGYGALLALSIGYKALRGREGLGLGDAKLLGALGGWFGWQALPFTLLLAAGIGLTAVLVAMASGRRVEASERVPFGTLLAIAALPAWLVAGAIS